MMVLSPQQGNLRLVFRLSENLPVISLPRCNFLFLSLRHFFGSKLRATENKSTLRIFLKRSLILIMSSNLTYLAPLGQFLMGAKLILGNP